MRNEKFILSLAFFAISLNFTACNDKEEVSDINPVQRTGESDQILNLLPEYMRQDFGDYQSSRDLVFYQLLTNANDPEVFSNTEEEDNLSSRIFSQYTESDSYSKIVSDIMEEDSISFVIGSGRERIITFIEQLEKMADQETDSKSLWEFLSNEEIISNQQPYAFESVLINSISASAKGAIQHGKLMEIWALEEGNEINPNLRVQANCFLGLKGSCWIGVLTQTAFDAIVGALGAGLISDAGFWEGVKGNGYIPAAVSFVKNTYQGYKSSACSCSGKTTCSNPTDFRLMFSSCDNTALFQPFPLDGYTGVIDYTISYGGFPEFQNTYQVSTPNHSIIAKQTNNSTPIGLSIATYCGSSSPRPLGPKQYDLYYLSRSAGPISINGDEMVDVNWTERYTAIGLGTKNSNNNISFSVNYAGQIVGEGFYSDGTPYVDVKWKIKSQPNSWGGYHTRGTIYIESTNTCSGDYISIYKNVIVM